MSLASDYFAAYIPWHSLRCDIDELVHEIYGDWKEIRLDYYDESIEVYGCTPTREAYDRLRAEGFRLVWQHAHPQCGPDGETGIACEPKSATPCYGPTINECKALHP